MRYKHACVSKINRCAIARVHDANYSAVWRSMPSRKSSRVETERKKRKREGGNDIKRGERRGDLKETNVFGKNKISSWHSMYANKALKHASYDICAGRESKFFTQSPSLSAPFASKWSDYFVHVTCAHTSHPVPIIVRTLRQLMV